MAVYGDDCPVTVTYDDTEEVRNCVFICPELDRGSDDDGKQRISYAVQFWQSQKVSIAFFGVAAEGVEHRMGVKASINDSGFRKGGRIVAAKENAVANLIIPTRRIESMN